jgi:hypothetical protein
MKNFSDPDPVKKFDLKMKNSLTEPLVSFLKNRFAPVVVVAPVVLLTPSAAGPLRRLPILLVVGCSGVSLTNRIPAFHRSL